MLLKGCFGMFWKSRPKVGGEIRRYGLDEWWLEELSPLDRKTLQRVYQPLGFSMNSLTQGNVVRQPELDTQSFLANLATWVNRPETKALALKVADKAREQHRRGDSWGKHFALMNLCRVYYRWREEGNNLAHAIWACEESIAMSHNLSPEADGEIVLSHHCFKQLAIIEEKRGNYARAIEICEQAKKQGWAGDWERRILRLMRKTTKNGPT